MIRIGYVSQQRRGLRELLEQLSVTGYMVYRMDPNEMAYGRLRDNPPDIIIADATLRDNHVRTVVNALCSSPITRSIPICIVGVDQKSLPKMRKAGCTAKTIVAGEVTRKMLVDIVKQLATTLLDKK